MKEGGSDGVNEQTIQFVAAVRAARAQTLTSAYVAHPARFVRKPPEPPALPGTVWINKPEPTNSTNP